MVRIKGRFYLKQTRNGNLVGEFSNNGNTSLSTESCDSTSIVPTGSFIGNYQSTWQEGGQALFADLHIIAGGRLFELTWSRNGKVIFKGTGMLCDDTLIGDYQSV
jgi:hypothetical protein